MATAAPRPAAPAFPYDIAALTDAPLRIEAVARFDADAARVFAALGDLGDLSYVPFIRRTEVDHAASHSTGRAGVGTERVCTVTGMGQLHERILLWDPPRGYAYRAHSRTMPLAAHLGVIVVDPAGPAGSLVTWRQYVRLRRAPHAPLFPVVARWIMRRALTNLTRDLGGQVVRADLVRARPNPMA